MEKTNLDPDNNKLAIDRDRFGNPKGEYFDLALDNAFTGTKIAVLHLYTGEGFDFELPKEALAKKGFDIIYWKDHAPSASMLKQELETSSQLWLISDTNIKLQPDHIQEIINFFKQGKGLYILGDNEPYFADANQVLNKLFQITMSGNFEGNTVLGLQDGSGKRGLLKNHEISTGIEHLFEGDTVAVLKGEFSDLIPLLNNSNGDPLAVCYDKNGRRAIIDGGFTRLFCNWDSAGTARYVVNAATWLVNDLKIKSVELTASLNSASIIDKFAKRDCESEEPNVSVPSSIINKF